MVPQDLKGYVTGKLRRSLIALWSAVGAILLIAGVNLSNLLLARAAARTKEFALRGALGASRGRLLRQSLTESLLLAVTGAFAGCLLAEGLLRLFIAIAPTGVPFLADATIDGRIVAFAFAAALLCGVIFGIMNSTETPRAQSLAARATLSKAHVRLRRFLVAAQIEISVVLLASASLLMKSFQNLENQNLGLSSRRVLLLRRTLPDFLLLTGKFCFLDHMIAEYADGASHFA